MSNNTQYKKGYVITAVKKDGVRYMAFDNNERNTYIEKAAAEKYLNDALTNNSPERVTDLIGKDLQVTEVDLYPGGDSTRTVFGSAEYTIFI